jgi:Xaa-Pro aminopeptidase
MQEEMLDVCFVSNPANFRYLTGIVSDFFISPTRPWFVIVPVTGEPIAVVPEAGRPLLETTSITDIRTWLSPQPEDEGITLLLAALSEVGGHSSVLGAEIGVETRLGMPTSDFDRLRSELPRDWQIRDCGRILQRTRMIKTPTEVEQIAVSCEAASKAFSEIGAFMTEGVTETELAREYMLLGLKHGAERCPYLTLSRGQGGYEIPLIIAPQPAPIQRGDVIAIDAGFTVGGYFCDFNRNWSIGHDDLASKAHQILYDVTERGLEAARPGAPVSAVWQAMAGELERHGGLVAGARMGHGLGLDITEPPSLNNTDGTEMQPGMVLTIEPGLVYGPKKLMLHEEVIVIEKDGNRLLTARAEPELPEIRWPAR